MARAPGFIPTGTIPGWPTEFTSAGRLSFARPVGEDAARWWNAKIFNKNQMFPGTFAERQSFGLPGTHSYRYDLIDPHSQTIRLEMSGESAVRVPLWIHGQDIISQKETVFETAVLIDEGQQGRGLLAHKRRHSTPAIRDSISARDLRSAFAQGRICERVALEPLWAHRRINSEIAFPGSRSERLRAELPWASPTLEIPSASASIPPCARSSPGCAKPWPHRRVLAVPF
jgi:hypothetical protein